MKILVTGGVGYIGTHTLIELYQAGFEAVVIDNLSNSCIEALNRTEQIIGTKVPFYQGDILDRSILARIFSEHKIDAVIHFAALKAVGESVQKPLDYYHVDVSGAIVLMQEMQKAQVNCLVFSSSATVYGESAVLPIPETATTGGTTNPYGTSKYIVERIMMDNCIANPNFSAIILRYFNPVGAYESGEIGEDPNGVPNNLMPYISQVAVGKLKELSVFGDDYPTKDGTGERDYIHVMDLANGHVQALAKHQAEAGCHIYNLGTGNPVSVLEMVQAFTQENNVAVPYKIAPRREGDIATCYADSTKAWEKLGWKTQRNLKQMVVDTWNWQKKNPNGFKS